jgi:2-C-methyl-D-erythritol 4-phosphate cytidylyltransferase
MLTAIIVAAGGSRRMGFDKLFAMIASKPVIAHSIDPFERGASVSEIIVVAREDRHGDIKKVVRDENFQKIRAIIAGGEHRQDSVRAGLDRLSADAKYVAVHDAARPLIRAEQIERVFKQCRIHGAASLAEPISDTLKRADIDPLGSHSGQVLMVTGSVDRQRLYAMQTPQIFERALIEKAYNTIYARSISVTDEVSAVQQLGRDVLLVENDDFNFKITYPRDLPLAEFLLKQRRQLAPKA